MTDINPQTADEKLAALDKRWDDMLVRLASSLREELKPANPVHAAKILLKHSEFDSESYKLAEKVLAEHGQDHVLAASYEYWKKYWGRIQTEGKKYLEPKEVQQHHGLPGEDQDIRVRALRAAGVHP